MKHIKNRNLYLFVLAVFCLVLAGYFINKSRRMSNNFTITKTPNIVGASPEQNILVDAAPPKKKPAVDTTNDTRSFIEITKDWKTYSATSADYSFKYPAGVGYADPRGGAFLGKLDGKQDHAWETNFLLEDKNNSNIMFVYAPPTDKTTLENSLGDGWTDPKKYSKSSETINGVVFDTYTAINISSPYNNVSKGYATTRTNRHYVISLPPYNFTLAQQILSTFVLK